MNFEKPQVYKAKVAEKYHLTENGKFLLLKFELITPARIKFQAGQHVSMKINGNGERRSYSVANTPDVEHAVTIVADVLVNGVGSQYLKALSLGETVEILAPLGRFVVDEESIKDTKKSLLFVATGSGIAPLKPMIEDLLINRKVKNPIRLHWGLRYEEDVFWFDNFERLMEEYPNFVFDLTLSQPSDGWRLCWGRVTDCVKRDFDKMQEWDAYLCGNQAMIRDMTEILVHKGVKQERILTEKFY